MKRIFSVFLIVACCTACNEGGVNVEVDTDSLNKKLENVSEKIEEKAEKVWDSTKAKATDLKDKAEQKWDSTKERHDNEDTTRK